MQVDATKLWDEFKSAHPRKHESAEQGEERRLAFLGGMSSAVGGLRTGEIKVVRDTEAVTVLAAPDIWGEYRAKCCKGVRGKMLEAVKVAFLAGATTGMHLVVVSAVPPEVVAREIMTAIGMTDPDEPAPKVTATDLWERYRDSVCPGESGDILHYQRLAFLAGVMAGLGTVMGDGADPVKLADSVLPAYRQAMLDDIKERTERN